LVTPSLSGKGDYQDRFQAPKIDVMHNRSANKLLDRGFVVTDP